MQPLSFLELPAHGRVIPQHGHLVGAGAPLRQTPKTRHYAAGLTSLIGCAILLVTAQAWGHGVEEGDANFLQSQQGFHFGRTFTLVRNTWSRAMTIYSFSGSHILSLSCARNCNLCNIVCHWPQHHVDRWCWFDVPANAYLIDAIIGFSIVYKAFENMGGFARLGFSPNTKVAVWVFGLFHGFGLATKLQAIDISPDGLLANLLAFNLGVEAGQILSLIVIVSLVNAWRRSQSFARQALLTNSLIMSAGFVFLFYQMTGYYLLS